MFAFIRSDARRIAVSATGALLLSGICIGGVVAPAQAVAAVPATTIAAWTQDTARRIDTDLVAPAGVMQGGTRNVQIGVIVQPDGTVSEPRLLQSSGYRRLDNALMRRAETLVLAPFPAGQTGARGVVLRVPLQPSSGWATVNWPVAARYAAR